jgi:hypothetical protein
MGLGELFLASTRTMAHFKEWITMSPLSQTRTSRLGVDGVADPGAARQHRVKAAPRLLGGPRP